MRTLIRRAPSPPALVWLTAVWLLLWGSVSPLAIVSGLLIAAALLLATPQPAVEIGLRLRPWHLLSLLAYVTTDLVLASCRVAWQVVTPRLPPSAVYAVPLRVRGGLMITMVAIAVSAVPGSTVIDARPEDGTLEIHVFDASRPDTEERLRREVRGLERRLVAAFGSGAERARVRAGYKDNRPTDPPGEAAAGDEGDHASGHDGDHANGADGDHASDPNGSAGGDDPADGDGGTSPGDGADR